MVCVGYVATHFWYRSDHKKSVRLPPSLWPYASGVTKVYDAIKFDLGSSTMYARTSVSFCDGSRGVLLKISYECINCRRVRMSVIARNAPYFGKVCCRLWPSIECCLH